MLPVLVTQERWFVSVDELRACSSSLTKVPKKRGLVTVRLLDLILAVWALD